MPSQYWGWVLSTLYKGRELLGLVLQTETLSSHKSIEFGLRPHRVTQISPAYPTSERVDRWIGWITNEEYDKLKTSMKKSKRTTILQRCQQKVFIMLSYTCALKVPLDAILNSSLLIEGESIAYSIIKIASQIKIQFCLHSNTLNFLFFSQNYREACKRCIS